MILSVAYVEEVSSLTINMTHTLWMMETSFLKSSINKSNFTIRISNDINTFHIQYINNNYSIITSVRYAQQWKVNSILFFNANYFLRKFQVLWICILLFFC